MIPIQFTLLPQGRRIQVYWLLHAHLMDVRSEANHSPKQTVGGSPSVTVHCATTRGITSRVRLMVKSVKVRIRIDHAKCIVGVGPITAMEGGGGD